jgi:hypothetical protein
MWFGDLVTAITRRGVRERATATQEQREEWLIALTQAINELELERGRWAADFEKAGAEADEWDQKNTALDWLRSECRLGSTRAVDALDTGRVAEQLPQSVEALKSGEIGFEHLALMARVAHAVEQSPMGDKLFDERELLNRARSQSVRRFRSTCAHVHHAVDAENFLAGFVTSADFCRLKLMANSEGALMLRGSFDPISAASIRTALEALARKNGSEDHRAREQRLADALTELCEHAMDKGSLPSRGSVRPHLHVTASVETLLGVPGAPAGEMDLVGAVPGATVQRLACDATVTDITLDRRGEVFDVGRAKRMPPPPMRKALEYRDKGCVWPGCERDASWTTSHHVHFWGWEGKTRTKNLALLCRRHHWMVHEGGWKLFKTPEGIVVVHPEAPDLWWPRAPAATGS